MTGVTEDSAQVGWYQPILGPGETLLGYQVSVVEVISEDNVDQYTTQDTSITVENLKPHTEYSVSVAALGTSAVASVFITAQLEEAGKWHGKCKMEWKMENRLVEMLSGGWPSICAWCVFACMCLHACVHVHV